MTTPCEWPISYAGCPEPTWNTEQQEAAESMATELLWNWTGRAYGLCEAVIRPRRADCFNGAAPTFWGRGPYSPGNAFDHSVGVPWGPALIGGQWYNIGCGTCGDSCSCGLGPSSLRLPSPVQEVEEVRVDGAVLPTLAYRVDNQSLLVRLDGGRWPLCQNLGAPIEEPGTWQVSYLRGHEVPTSGQIAAGILAAEMHKANCGDATCQLPKRLQSITRQGVTIALIDAFEDVTKGRTGIWAVDAWVASVMNSPKASHVYSPDIPRPRHRTQTWPT